MIRYSWDQVVNEPEVVIVDLQATLAQGAASLTARSA
jgi:hypothetical protein